MTRTGSPGIAWWLGLAATPTFAAMALVTAATGTGHGANGMLPMYLLMALFHLPPWLAPSFGRSA